MTTELCVVIGVIVSYIVGFASGSYFYNDVLKLKEKISKNENNMLSSLTPESIQMYAVDSDVLLKFLNESINLEINFMVNNILSSFKNKNEQRMLVDEDIKEMTVIVSNNVLEGLSEEYLKNLTLYVKDTNQYISKRVYYALLPLILDLNKKQVMKGM
jgi:hypothetical protein